MSVWTVDFAASVTVEAPNEDAAIEAAVKKLDTEPDVRNELEFRDFDAWEE